MSTPSMFTDNAAITMRPAKHADLPAIADLLIQLYAAELPGALNGSLAGQQALMLFTLQANNTQGLHRRYVASTTAGDVIATAAIEAPGEPRYERAPTGTISKALTYIGYQATARLLLTVAQSMLGTNFKIPTDAVFVHSVVVDAQRRGQGIGQTLMQAVEQSAREQGYSSAVLQVLAANQPARRLYRQCGYQEIWQSPHWASRLSWPSYIMQKMLVSRTPKANANLATKR